METTQSQEVASIILQQLGGNKFLTMTGSKNLVADGKSLSMKLIPNKSKAQYLKIRLLDSDTYKMEFMSFSPTKGACTIRIEYAGVYADQLQELFRKATGLNTSL